VNFKLDTASRRISFAVGVSILAHVLVLWGPDVRLPRFKSSLPALTAKLEALPAAPVKPKRKSRPAAPKPAPEPAPQTEEQQQPPQDATQAASAPVATDPPASGAGEEVMRPPLPKRAQLTFSVYKGTGGFRVGEAIHTLEIDDGRYILNAVTRTVGLVSLFKSYELTQYSSGSYNKSGLQPELFFEQRKDKLTTLRYTAEFDHETQVVRFSPGGEFVLPPETMDILSVMYQFPPLAHTEMVEVSVSNGRKIERYAFEVAAEEKISTALGELLTVHLHKMHSPNEEGLDIWLAREYRLFPVKIQFIEKNGEVTGEAVITDIRVSEEEGVRKDVVN
jgi:hypothetical protein